VPYVVSPHHPYLDLLPLMEETDNELARLLPAEIAEPTYGKFTCVALLADSLASHRGVRFLLREGLGDEAGVLTRKQIEVAAVLVYFGGQSERLEELAAQFMYHLYTKELTLWKADEKAGYRKEAAEAEKEITEEMTALKQTWRASGNQGKVTPFPSTAELLGQMRQGDKQSLLERGHLYVHVSRMGLEGRLRNAGTSEAHFDTNGDPDRCVSVGAVATDLLLGAAQGGVAALGWSDEAARISELRMHVGPQLVDLLKRRTTKT
jgi:hypothetical protein